MKFKRIINYLIRAKKILIIIYNNRKFMRNGFLQVDIKLKYVFNNEFKTIKFVRNILIGNNYKLTRQVLFGRFIKIPFFTISSKSFYGDVCLLSNSDNKNFDIKFFDLKNNNVLTKYSKSKDLTKKIENYNLFSAYFKSPDILSYNLNKKICIEKYIETIPKKSWTNLDYKIVINFIFIDYTEYFRCLELKNNYLSISGLLNEFSNYKNQLKSLCFISENLTSVKDQNIPIVNQHGDLWLYNILLDNNKKIFYIDWEHSNKYCFFYDIFWWIINESIYEKNNEFLNNYLQGKYDKQFENLFSAVDKKYNKDLRKTYLYLFIAELFSKRILSKSDLVINDADKLYYTLLIYINKF